MNNMNIAKSVLAFSIIAGLSFGAGKAASATGGVTHNSDGCGVGWQFTKKKTLFGTTTRGTTNNGIAPTFGMSSGTLGCQKHDFAENEKTAVDFAAANVDSLSVEMAEGGGEFVAGLADAMGCPAAKFSEATQSNYSVIFSADTGVGVYRNIKEVIRNDASLSSSCTIG